MVGFTKQEKECNECTGLMKSYCDGPEYLGGMCSCECHEEGNRLYEYNNGRPRLREQVNDLKISCNKILGDF